MQGTQKITIDAEEMRAAMQDWVNSRFDPGHRGEVTAVTVHTGMVGGFQVEMKGSE